MYATARKYGQACVKLRAKCLWQAQCGAEHGRTDMKDRIRSARRGTSTFGNLHYQVQEAHGCQSPDKPETSWYTAGHGRRLDELSLEPPYPG